MSPTQKLYGQDSFPTHPWVFVPEWQHSTEQTEQATQSLENAALKYYNATAHSVPDIKVGTHVTTQNPRTKLWDTYGMVKFIGKYKQELPHSDKERSSATKQLHICVQKSPSINTSRSVSDKATSPTKEIIKIQETYKKTHRGPLMDVTI